MCGHVIRTNDKGNHGRSITTSRLQTLDQFLHLPDLDVLLGLRIRIAHDCGLILSAICCSGKEEEEEESQEKDGKRKRSKS